MQVSFQDVYGDIVVPGGVLATDEVTRWQTDRRYASEVAPFVQSFTHSHIFDAERQDFDAIKNLIESDEREHALFGVNRSDNIPLTRDLNTPWAFIHLFHRYVEERQRIPTWLEWKHWLLTDASALFRTPVERRLRFATMNEAWQERVRKGLRWRLGNAYYSCMRELDVLMRLRDDYGLQVKYHVFADALFRVDYWIGNKTACLFVSNDEMKAAQSGRKPRPGKYLSSPPFIHYEAVMEKQHTYARLHLATEETVAGIATALR